MLFPALYYGAQYSLASTLPTVTVATIFSKRFGWEPLDIGLAYGAALTAGGLLGELAAGVVVDAMIERGRRERGGVDPPPEVRLDAIWTGAGLVPAGLLIYGFTLEYRTAWMGPLMGMGIAVFGVQVVATTCYTYIVDCYRAKSSETAQLFSFVRQEFGMTFAFYAIRLCGGIGYQ